MLKGIVNLLKLPAPEVARQLTFAALRRSLRDGDVRLERLGTEYGGWYVPVDLVGPDAIVYSVGIGEDASFDLELIRRCGCVVHGFDPTPRARTYVETHCASVPGFRFHPYGIWKEDGSVRFFAPRDPKHVSHSIANLQHTSEYFVGEVKALASAMRELGHRHIDLLKMDVEGAEYAILDHMLSRGIRPGFVCVELESPWPVPNLRAVRRLRGAGYDLVKLDGRNFTFRLASPGGGRRAD